MHEAFLLHTPFWFLAGVLVAVVFPLRFAVAAFRPWGGGILDDFCGRDSILARSFEQRIRTEGLRYFQSRGAQGASASEGTSSNFEGLTIFDEGRVCYIRDSAGEIMRDGLSSSDLDRIVSAFLATHDDEYDFIMLFTSFQWNQAFAFYSPIANDAAGIGYAHWAGRDRFDFSPGSPLQGFIFMNADFIYDGAETPNDQIITEIVFGQELGHRWGAYVHFDADPDPDTVEERDDLLGRQKAHWSYYVDTHWSWMEGNDWVDNGDGTFSADFETFPEEAGYFPLDLYLMGLIPAGEVPPSSSSPTPMRHGVPPIHPSTFGRAGSGRSTERGGM
ncbi:MAG: hypothetical protein D6795_16210 [Deltaproteobacteria bacterium]|nr:MAG: hypothetical protein D6795_16210 [Deltaproteobacteria bacterium]